MGLNAFAYFDTDAFHRVANTFREVSLSEGLRAHIINCQITLLEVLSQLSIKKGDEILARIKAIRNFTNPAGTALLPWPEDFLGTVVFSKSFIIDDENLNARQTEINICLQAQSVSELGEASGKIKDELDEYRSEIAGLFKIHVGQYRALTKKPKSSIEELTELWRWTSCTMQWIADEPSAC